MQNNTTTKNTNEIKSAKIDKSVNELIPELNYIQFSENSIHMRM